MAHCFGAVVLVPFPFPDQSRMEKRPAVVVAGCGYNAGRRDQGIVTITSQTHAVM